MMPDVTLEFRLATQTDIPYLRDLIPQSVRALSVDYYTPQQIESALVHIFGVDTQLIADGTFYVAQAGGEIVGCGGWSKRKTLFGGDQSKAEAVDSLLDPAREAARIRAFFVHPDWSRRGIGRGIIERCEAAARAAGFTAMQLVATLPGEPLYAALGYRVTERIEIPMPDGSSLPAAHMSKGLA
jgi:predicted N-acetyltransferase YhbS